MNKKPILIIQDLVACAEDQPILKNINLTIGKDEIHVIMGPNGSGKSTLSKVLAGHPSYQIRGGKIEFNEQNILEFLPEERSREGLFLAFQYPLEISGVKNFDFLRLAYNEKKKYLNQPTLTPIEFLEYIEPYLHALKIPKEFLQRDVNEGFSGGEKKKNEILQILLLQPKLIILDEIDSGVDIDALKIICQTLITKKEKDTSLLLITHYPKILEYFKPTAVHIMKHGKIVRTGNTTLINEIEQTGYQIF
jgi:Fe-S cluster assembly ATP-binding protein